MDATDQLLTTTFHNLRDELVGTLVYWLRRRDLAEDAAQETFLKCWRHREEMTRVTNLRAWVFRIGLNTAKDMQRSAWQRKARPMPEEHAMPVELETGPEANPILALTQREDLEHLRLAILELRDEEKEVFLLRQNGDLTYEQIADIRGLPVGTVKTQMRAALQKLRARLQ